MRTQTLVAAAVVTILRVASGAHSDMFSCRSKSCPVAELTDANYATKIGASPHFVMFYAPWCGHCKQLAPKLKKAAKELNEWGVQVGAVDVEPNRNVQSMYPDIRGFPTLKFVKSTTKAEDYNGPRETEDIVIFSKEQASKVGALHEPMQMKKLDELYTFFARAALDSKPALLLAGKEDTAPEWFGAMHAALRSFEGESYESEAKAKLEEALSVAKSSAVKEAVQNVLSDISTKAKSQSKPMFAAAYTNDPAALDASHFNASTLYVAFVDRKNLASSALCAKAVSSVANGGKKNAPKKELEAWARDVKREECIELTMPDLPKPASVKAAEERAAKKKAQASEVAVLTSPSDLASKCYELKDRTCALILLGGDDDTASSSDSDLAALAAKYARNGFAFASLAKDAPRDLVDALAAGYAAPTLVILKAGRRPRAARASGLANFDALLDDVLAGGAKFDKFDAGLPEWISDAAAQQPPASDDYDL